MANYFYDWKRAGEHAKAILGPYEAADAAQAARDGIAAAFPGDEVSAVYEADPATVRDEVPRAVARVASAEGEIQVWSDGFTEVIGG